MRVSLHGILQAGLHALANDLGVTFGTSIHLENWKNVIDQIEVKIRDLEKQPKSVEKDMKTKAYAQMAVQFRYFKDAWRNHVCHYRATYDIHQAQSIMIHVADFMEMAAERLAEVPN